MNRLSDGYSLINEGQIVTRGLHGEYSGGYFEGKQDLFVECIRRNRNYSATGQHRSDIGKRAHLIWADI